MEELRMTYLSQLHQFSWSRDEDLYFIYSKKAVSYSLSLSVSVFLSYHFSISAKEID
jgi:hypothetical protein